MDSRGLRGSAQMRPARSFPWQVVCAGLWVLLLAFTGCRKRAATPEPLAQGTAVPATAGQPASLGDTPVGGAPATTRSPALATPVLPVTQHLSSVSDATPIPTNRLVATPEKSQSTSTPKATSTPRYPTEFNTSTPAAGVEAYRLRSWTEANSRSLSDLVLKGEWLSLMGAGFMPGQYRSYTLPFLYEQILRYPDSPAWKEAAWRAVRFDPGSGPLVGLQPGQDLFIYLVEDLLNNQGVTVDKLPKKLEGYDIGIRENLKVENLFGDGQAASVFQAEIIDINSYSSNAGYFAVRQINGLFQLEVLKNWAKEPRTYYKISQVLDYNANGIPEVGILVEGGASGMPYGCHRKIYLAEWQGTAFVALADNLYIFAYDSSDGPCAGIWGFGESVPGGVAPLILTEYRYTLPVYRKPQVSCPDLEIQHIYAWDGQRYVFQRDEWVASSSEDAACQIAWAYVDVITQGQLEGVWDQRAIDILAKQLENWPAQADKLFGPASRDYFALQLGIWRDLRGEGNQVVALLRPLSRQPTVAEYDLPSRLAASYLDGRGREGILRACRQALAAWGKIEIASEYQDDTFDPDLFRQQWGFSGPWSYYWWDVPDLCDEESAMNADISTRIIRNRANLEDWLAQAGVTWLALEPADLNADGVQDWLALTDDHPEEADSGVELWAFLHRPEGWKAFRLTYYWQEPKPALLKWQALRPEADAAPFNLVLVGYELYMYEIAADRLEFDWFLGYGVTAYQVDEHPAGAVITLTENTWRGMETSAYTWDREAWDFVNISDYDFAAAQAEAERLLFQERDYEAAISFIDQFLEHAPPEPLACAYREDDVCIPEPDWYHSYLRYLLGIASELAGFPEQATRVYYWLWHDYPTHLYGMAAALKLEPIGTHP